MQRQVIGYPFDLQFSSLESYQKFFVESTSNGSPFDAMSIQALLSVDNQNSLSRFFREASGTGVKIDFLNIDKVAEDIIPQELNQILSEHFVKNQEETVLLKCIDIANCGGTSIVAGLESLDFTQFVQTHRDIQSEPCLSLQYVQKGHPSPLHISKTPDNQYYTITFQVDVHDVWEMAPAENARSIYHSDNPLSTITRTISVPIENPNNASVETHIVFTSEYEHAMKQISKERKTLVSQYATEVHAIYSRESLRQTQEKEFCEFLAKKSISSEPIVVASKINTMLRFSKSAEESKASNSEEQNLKIWTATTQLYSLYKETPGNFTKSIIPLIKTYPDLLDDQFIKKLPDNIKNSVLTELNIDPKKLNKKTLQKSLSG